MHRTTQNQASSHAKQSPYFIQITAGTAAITGLLFGFDTGVISGAILFINREFGLTPFTEELLVSAALIGAVCSSILSGRLTDLIGRKRAILGTTLEKLCKLKLPDQTGAAVDLTLWKAEK
jgi:Sugar (and other) transporter